MQRFWRNWLQVNQKISVMFVIQCKLKDWSYTVGKTSKSKWSSDSPSWWSTGSLHTCAKTRGRKRTLMWTVRQPNTWRVTWWITQSTTLKFHYCSSPLCDKKCPFVKNGINTVKLIKSCGWNSVYSNLKNISQKQPIYLSKK